MVHGGLLRHSLQLIEQPSSHDPTSFLLVPSSIRQAGENLASWLGSHFPGHGVAPAEFDPNTSAPVLAAKKLKDEVQRVVDYYAKDCPHSQNLDPVWKGAQKDWEAAGHSVKLKWQQKECYGADWKKGKDYEDCQKEGIESFPTIKYYYGKKDQFGEEILEHNDKDRLLDFIESRADPQAWDKKAAAFGLTPEQEDAGLSASWGEGQYMAPAPHFGGGKVVDYYSTDCVHCQHLDPVWKNAQRMWKEDHPSANSDLVQWEKKECFGSRWEPGKDYGECQAQGIHSFPTVRFHAANSDAFEDFTAQRTAKNLLNFVNERAQPADGWEQAPADTQAVATAPAKAARQADAHDKQVEDKPEPVVAKVGKPDDHETISKKKADTQKAPTKGDLQVPEQATLAPLLPAVLLAPQRRAPSRHGARFL